MISPAPEANPVVRSDPLIGCGNLLGFAEYLTALAREPLGEPLSLLFLDINHFARVNAEAGPTQGDAVLRWIGIILMEDSQAPVYRIGGDELVAVLAQGSHADHKALAMRIFERLNSEAERFGLVAPVASMTLLPYAPGVLISPGDLMVRLGEAIFDVKMNSQRSIKLYGVEPDHQLQAADRQVLHWLSNLMLQRILSLGSMLDEANHLAFTDPVSGLPNMRAAESALQATLNRALSTRAPFSLLFLDGDDLHEYNLISYAAGDEMIRQLGELLNTYLRPTDFLARWRVGDEFLAILEDTRGEQADLVGSRLCKIIEHESKNWPLPVTISVGVACFPDNGESVEDLIQHAERANQRAKDLGKNQVVSQL